ncbi:hypothetical protein [Caldicellulosiruptor acetigenus]|nr:hypothetical protein [Caldicellulosiruptor acetigenus]
MEQATADIMLLGFKITGAVKKAVATGWEQTTGNENHTGLLLG